MQNNQVFNTIQQQRESSTPIPQQNSVIEKSISKAQNDNLYDSQVQQSNDKENEKQKNPWSEQIMKENEQKEQKDDIRNRQSEQNCNLQDSWEEKSNDKQKQANPRSNRIMRGKEQKNNIGERQREQEHCQLQISKNNVNFEKQIIPQLYVPLQVLCKEDIQKIRSQKKAQIIFNDKNKEIIRIQCQSQQMKKQISKELSSLIKCINVIDMKIITKGQVEYQQFQLSKRLQKELKQKNIYIERIPGNQKKPTKYRISGKMQPNQLNYNARQIQKNIYRNIQINGYPSSKTHQLIFQSILEHPIMFNLYKQLKLKHCEVIYKKISNPTHLQKEFDSIKLLFLHQGNVVNNHQTVKKAIQNAIRTKFSVYGFIVKRKSKFIQKINIDCIPGAKIQYFRDQKIEKSYIYLICPFGSFTKQNKQLFVKVLKKEQIIVTEARSLMKFNSFQIAQIDNKRYRCQYFPYHRPYSFVISPYNKGEQFDIEQFLAQTMTF